MIVWWWWLSCSRTGPVAAPPPAVQAGPRAILDDPAPTGQDDGLAIGRNEAVAYLQRVRATVMPVFRSCLEQVSHGQTEDRTLVEGRVTAEGRSRDVVVSRSSGDRLVDDCARRAMDDTMLPAPPTRLLDETGSLELPSFAFGVP